MMYCIIGMAKLTDTLGTHLIHTLSQWCSWKKLFRRYQWLTKFSSHLQVPHDHGRRDIPRHFISLMQHYLTEKKCLACHFPVVHGTPWCCLGRITSKPGLFMLLEVERRNFSPTTPNQVKYWVKHYGQRFLWYFYELQFLFNLKLFYYICCM